MKLDWNLQRGGGSKEKSLPWGRNGYFLEPHNPSLNLPHFSCLSKLKLNVLRKHFQIVTTVQSLEQERSDQLT